MEVTHLQPRKSPAELSNGPGRLYLQGGKGPFITTFKRDEINSVFLGDGDSEIPQKFKFPLSFKILRHQILAVFIHTSLAVFFLTAISACSPRLSAAN